MLQAETVQLLCLTAASGVPLFSRGSNKQLPFSVIGSLNGVHMFGAGQGALLSSCETDRGSRVVWRVFRDTLTLIAVSGSGDGDAAFSELHLRRLLENAWSCMVLVLGQDELVNVRNVERLKRELRSCFRLIDRLLERRAEEQGIMGDLTHCADCLLPFQPGVLQEALDSFTRAAGSEFGCLLVSGRVTTATEKWWRLAPQEIVLLSLLINSLSDSMTSCDYPVFLPHGSPTIAHRLLCFRLVAGAVVCVLCGPSPSLHKVQTELVVTFWSPVLEILRSCSEQVQHSTLPPSVSLRWDIQALLLVNRESRRSVAVCPAVRSPASSEAPPLSAQRRWELLRLFYTFAVTHYFTSEEPAAATLPDLPASADSSASANPKLFHEEFAQGFTHQPLQCYLVTDECKCFGLQTTQHQLYLLTDLSVPTFALRSIATNTLTAVTSATGF